SYFYGIMTDIIAIHKCVTVWFKQVLTVKLEFIYPKKAMKIQASWMKFNVTHKENIAVLHPIYGIHIEDTYNGRISFGNTSSEDKSLFFIKSTLQNVIEIVLVHGGGCSRWGVQPVGGAAGGGCTGGGAQLGRAGW
uniref:Uncharacterized protein n=1 Tax=Amazona collaria TaxID=241587 RepID=A0A8B9G159_9PSIT